MNILNLKGFGMRTNLKSIAYQSNQRGFVLITALMFLIILTLLGLSSMRTNSLLERMAGYSIDRQVALQAAEAALRDAELDISKGRASGDTGFSDGCGNAGYYKGLCKVNIINDPIWVALSDPANEEYSAWVKGVDGLSKSRSVAYGKETGKLAYTIGSGFSTSAASQSPAGQPRYIIEAVSFPGGGSLVKGFDSSSQDYIYRVTAVGFGRRGTSRVMLQAVLR